MKFVLAIVLVLTLSSFGYAQSDELNTRQLQNIRIQAMLDYARATFLFQSDRFSSEQARLQKLIEQNNLAIRKLVEAAKVAPAKEEPKPVQ